MDDPRSGNRSDRLDELPDHEDDADVASQAGGGVLDEGMTAEVRGTGGRTGNAQGLDEEATRRDPGDVTGMDPGDGDPPTWAGDPTPGIHDFTQTAEDADRG